MMLRAWSQWANVSRIFPMGARALAAVKPSTNYYDVMNVKSDASAKEIKSQYYKLSMKFHPDRNHGDEAAKAAFVRINEAYTVLSNDVQRNEYDAKMGLGRYARANQPQYTRPYSAPRGGASTTYYGNSGGAQASRGGPVYGSARASMGARSSPFQESVFRYERRDADGRTYVYEHRGERTRQQETREQEHFESLRNRGVPSGLLIFSFIIGIVRFFFSVFARAPAARSRRR